MINSPIKLKEFPQNIENVRKKKYEDESEKILAGKGIILTKFQTDKSRIVIKKMNNNKFHTYK